MTIVRKRLAFLAVLCYNNNRKTGTSDGTNRKGGCGMSKRIETVKQILKQKILQGEPGFLEGTPSIRELTALLNESRHVAAAALKELEEEKILLCTPQKGFKVNPAFRAVPTLDRRNAPDVEVVFTEDLPWQTDFWCRVIRKFEMLHPQWKIKPYFLPDPEKVRELLDLRRSHPVVIVRSPDELHSRGIGFVPISEIERNCGSGFRKEDIIPELQNLRLSDSMPYLLQPSMLFYRTVHGGEEPDTSSWLNLMKWAKRCCGSHSVMPVNTTLMLHSIGFFRRRAMNDAELREKLEELTALLSFIRDNELYSVDMRTTDRFEQARRLLIEHSGAAVKNSFYFGAFALKGETPPIGVHSLPLAADGSSEIPYCRISMAAPECTRPAAEFFGFILGETVQTALLKECHGLSPYRSSIQKVIDHPEIFHPGLASVASQVLNLPEHEDHMDHSNNSNVEEFITRLLTDRLFLPLLSSKPAEEELARLLPELVTQIRENCEHIHRKQYMQNLRDLLLH